MAAVMVGWEGLVAVDTVTPEFERFQFQGFRKQISKFQGFKSFNDKRLIACRKENRNYVETLKH